MTEVLIRPMLPEDVPDVERVCDDAFYDIDVRTQRPDLPPPARRTPERSQRWIARTLATRDGDPGGCWVAEDDSGLLGFAVAIVRERLWILATFAVRPGDQGRGIGRRLLAAAEAYGAACDRGLLAASDDPLAVRRYHLAGFRLHPQLMFRGVVERSTLPAISGLRDGTEDDRGWIDDLDRALRGAPHGRDHASLAASNRLVVANDRTGYAYATDSEVALLAARDGATATRLLWECLAGSGGSFAVGHVTTANRWAVDVLMEARFSMVTQGYLGVRGMDPPAPYVHNGALL